MAELHVVYGAHGALGSAIVRRLAREGIAVRAVVRRAAAKRLTWPPRVEVFRGDALYRRSAIDAAHDATVVYRCIPLKYSMWAEAWRAQTENIITAARITGARLVSPGNVYVYGELGDEPVTEDHALEACGEKGCLRIETQQMLFQAHQSGDVPVVIPRFPDPYGPFVTGRVFGPIFESALRGKPAPWFGNVDARRDFLYIDDAAAAAIRIGRRPDAFGQVWHVPGAGPMTPREFIDMVYHAAGAEPRIHSLSPSLVRLKSVVDAETREFLEFRYLFEKPSMLSGAKFAAAFPDFEYTPHETAIGQTLDWFSGRKAQEAMEKAVS